LPREGRLEDPEEREGELLLPPLRLGAGGRLTEEPEDFFGAGGRLVLLGGGEGARLGGVVVLVEGGLVPDGGDTVRVGALVSRGGIDEVLRLVPELPPLPEGRFTPL
jgi:hypothetical protein